MAWLCPSLYFYAYVECSGCRFHAFYVWNGCGHFSPSIRTCMHMCICVYELWKRAACYSLFIYMYTDTIEEAVINLLVYIYNGAEHLDPLTHLCGGQRGCRAHTSYIYIYIGANPLSAASWIIITSCHFVFCIAFQLNIHFLSKHDPHNCLCCMSRVETLEISNISKDFQ